MQKKIALVLAVIVIIGLIVYLESLKSPHGTATTVLQSITEGTSTAPTAPTSPAHTNLSSSTIAAMTPAQFLAYRASTVAEESKEYESAPEITDPSGFVNTQPFTLASLVGKKVVLLDFWTYSCINCIRTIPYLNAWYQKYVNSGLTIVGIQTPEFQFEHDYNNVQAAVEKFGIHYPVVLDNDMGTWDAYQNLYWPHEYLINIDGFIVHDKVGEGDYAETEAAIQSALAERAVALGLPTSTIPTGTVDPSSTITINYNGVASPETYFGAERNEYLANGTQNQTGVQTLMLPTTFSSNALYLGGTWDFEDQYATTMNAGAKIVFEYNAKNVYMVATANSPVTIQILRDGQPLGADAGSDVSASGTVTIQADRLYNLVQGSDYGIHTLEITVENPGLNAYTFTFG